MHFAAVRFFRSCDKIFGNSDFLFSLKTWNEGDIIVLDRLFWWNDLNIAYNQEGK